MSTRVVKVSEGVGALHAGEVLLREVLYRLSRTVDDVGMVRPSEAFGPVEGQMDIGDLSEAVVLSGIDDLVLHLEDGRRVTIALTSTGGRFEVRGVAPVPDGLRDFATRYTAAWCSQDPARVAAFYAPEGSLRVNGGPAAVGRAAITGVAQGFMSAFPDLTVLLDDLVDEGNRPIYRWTLIGTNTGPGGSGRAVRIEGFEEWQLSADGLIAESAGHFDAADYQRQIDPS